MEQDQGSEEDLQVDDNLRQPVDEGIVGSLQGQPEQIMDISNWDLEDNKIAKEMRKTIKARNSRVIVASLMRGVSAMHCEAIDLRRLIGSGRVHNERLIHMAVDQRNEGLNFAIENEI